MPEAGLAWATTARARSCRAFLTHEPTPQAACAALRQLATAFFFPAKKDRKRSSKPNASFVTTGSSWFCSIRSNLSSPSHLSIGALVVAHHKLFGGTNFSLCTQFALAQRSPSCSLDPTRWKLEASSGEVWRGWRRPCASGARLALPAAASPAASPHPTVSLSRCPLSTTTTTTSTPTRDRSGLRLRERGSSSTPNATQSPESKPPRKAHKGCTRLGAPS
eukprot:1015705-Rhodomonas_salina.3